MSNHIVHLSAAGLRVSLGVSLTQDEHNKLALHHRITAPTNRGMDVVITMANNDDYVVIPA